MNTHTEQTATDSPVVTVYSKPGCVQCTGTYRKLTSAGVPFTVVDVTEDEEAFAHVVALGYKSLPVVEAVGVMHFNEFRPDLIDALAGILATPTTAHKDDVCRYIDGEFVVACSCGEQFTGQSPDDAAGAWSAHLETAA